MEAIREPQTKRDELLLEIALRDFAYELQCSCAGFGRFAPEYNNPLREAGISLDEAIKWVTEQLGPETYTFVDANGHTRMAHEIA